MHQADRCTQSQDPVALDDSALSLQAACPTGFMLRQYSSTSWLHACAQDLTALGCMHARRT